LPARTEVSPALPTRLFLYGTLLQCACNAVAVRLHRHLEPGLPAWVAGQLFAIPDPDGWYPALVPGEGTVRGMVHDLAPGFDAELLADLDAYEGLHEDGSGEYRRQMIAVATAAGEVSAAAYVYNAELPAGARLLPEGDFSEFLARSGLPAFR